MPNGKAVFGPEENLVFSSKFTFSLAHLKNYVMAQEANKIEWIVGTNGIVISFERKKSGTSEGSPFIVLKISGFFVRLFEFRPLQLEVLMASGLELSLDRRMKSYVRLCVLLTCPLSSVLFV